ncbi:hypothetical protein AAIR29_07275 [Psychrobacter sp. FBL11]|uniref:Uncharacterized protein n=1 Tax=Psychrobacter saeujeotis TaxID=3143436 RepID=A0ABU9X896_9GAMM|nr:hypothetical protein [uncultured Psychrobacter sp.]
MKVKLSKKFIVSVAYATNGTDVYMNEVLTGLHLVWVSDLRDICSINALMEMLYRDEVEETHLNFSVSRPNALY